MTPEAQRIAIAKARGAKWGHPVFNHDCKWHVHFAKEPFEFDSSWAGKPPPFDECVKELDVPDYLNDLNAMRPVEVEHIKERGDYMYLMNLHDVVVRDTPGKGFSALMVTATAAQRAEAFLRTLGLWTEENANSMSGSAGERRA